MNSNSIVSELRSSLRPALVLFALLSALTGLAYPLLVTGVAQVVFADAANGSLVTKDGKTVGSQLIGQAFSEPGVPCDKPPA